MEVKKLNLGDLMRKIKNGEVQLPDFQRDWVWKDEQIKSLLESVICGFPINSILLLSCDAGNIKFSCRTIEGVGAVDGSPQYLVLDGQQRLTSLFGALFSSEPVRFPNDKKCFYYVDMIEAIFAVETSETKKDLVVSVPSNGKLKSGNKIKLDLSTPEKEFAAGMFPLNQIFDSRKWLRGYEKFHNDDAAEKFTDDFAAKVIDKVANYEVISVELERNTPLEAVCKIFDKVNIGGTKLGVFDLLTAAFAMHVDENGKPVELRKDWDDVKKFFDDNGLKILSAIERTDFITALTLLVSYEKFRRDRKNPVSCKGEDILKLDCTDYLAYKVAVTDGFIEAAKFLEEEGITTEKYLPYKPQLIPMAAIFAELNLLNRNNADSRKKIRQWYWCAVFSEAYRDGQGARFAKDIVQIMRWIEKRDEPEIITSTQIGAWDLMKAKRLQSAIYKGVISIIFQHGAKDFLASRNMGVIANFAESIEIHHIFPKKYCAAQKISKDRFDNVANRTPIMKKTNRIIGDNAPSVYLEKIETVTGVSSADVDIFLESHFADAELCRADDFDKFIVDRAKKILDAVEELTGREVVGRDSPEIKKIFGVPLT